MNSSGPEKRKKTNENIQVYVRVRPTNTREKSLRSNEIVDVVLPKELVIKQSLDGRITKKFTFDRTFGPNCKQNEVYTTVVAPLIEEVLGGYSCTVFAYGQTGTGKTYTMVGNEEPKLSASSEDDDITGIIPRSLSHLFDDLRMMGVEFSMRISYLELYNEELCDLLSTDDSIKIRIFDDAQKKGSVIIQNLEEIPVHCKNDVYKLLAKGQERRKTAATLMNAQSSRSHTVFSILVHIKETNDDGEEMVRTGKLNLVDLAGSENISKSGNEKGIRARETVNINQSLLTLGRVITALVEKGPHIPYRESKLTRILQESLGGRTKTSIIATISPGHKDIEETLSTLEYAHRAKNIENRPEVNQRLTKRTVLKEYTEEIDRLKRELMAARDKNGIFLPDDTYNEMMFKMESQAKELNDKMMLMKALKEELQQKESLFEKGVLALNIRTEELKRTEHSLNVVQTELDVTRKALRTTKRRYDEKSVVLSKHVETEAVLTNQAKELIQVAETASADTYGLREAIERRKKTEEENMSKLENFATDFNSNTAAVKQHLSELLSCHKENISKITQKLDANNNEHKVFCELIQKFIDEILAVQQSSYEKIQTLTDKNHGDLEQMSANNLGSISLQFKEIIDLNIKQTNDIFSKLESIKKLNSITNSLIIDTNSHLIEKINKSTKVMHDKVTTTMDTLSSSCSANQQLVNTESNSMTNIVNSNISMTATQKEFIEKSIDNLNQILTLVNSTTTNNAQLLNKVNVVKTSIENTTKIQTENIAEVKKFVKTEFLNSAADITEDCVAYKDKLLTDNENFIDELDEMNDMLKYNDDVNDIAHKNLANIKQSKMIFSSRVIEGSNLIKQHIKQSKGDMDKRSKERCNDISVEQERSSQFASACKQENDEALTHVSNYVDCIQNNIITCEENYESLHKKDMKKYLSTGQTPAGKEFNINRKLAATSPDKVIIRRYRQERASNRDLCSSTVSEHNDENSVPDMPNVTLDDSIVFSTPIKGEPKREDPKMFLKELQVSQIMNKANDTE